MADLQHFLSLRAPACIEFKIQNVAGKGGFSFLKFVSGLTPIPMRCFENCTKSRKTWLKLVFQVSLECKSVCLLLGKDNRNRKIKLAFEFLIFLHGSNGTNMLKPCCKMCCCLCIRDKWKRLLKYQHEYIWYQYTLHILWHKVWGGKRPWFNLDTDTIVYFVNSVNFVNAIQIQLQMQI